MIVGVVWWRRGGEQKTVGGFGGEKKKRSPSLSRQKLGFPRTDSGAGFTLTQTVGGFGV